MRVFADAVETLRRAWRAGVGILVGLIIILVVPTATSADTTCVDSWTGGAGDLLWQSGENWSTGSAPGAEDVACVGAGYTVDVTAGSNVVGVLKDQGSLVLTGGSIELADSSEASTVKSLSVEGGTLTGAATLEVSDSLVWGAGTMSGSGETVLASGASGSIAAEEGGSVRLTERELVNAGTLTWGSGSIQARSNAEVSNSGTFNVNADVPPWEIASSGMLNEDGSNVWLHNTGTVKKAAGSAYTQIGFQVDNEGTVEAATGQIIFSGGSHGSDAANGAWLAPGGGSLAFSGGSFLLGSDVVMSGPVYLAGGNVQAGDIQAPEATLLLWDGDSTLDLTSTTTPSHIGSLELHATTTLTGAATVNITSSLAWLGTSTMSGSGATILGTEATGRMELSSGCEAMHLEGRRLLNEGTVTFGPGTIYLSAGTQLQNDGTFKDDSETSCNGPQMQVASGGSPPAISNAGTFEKVTGGGTTTVAVNFDNQGHVEARTGHLTFSDGGIPDQVATGAWETATGGIIELTGGTFLIGEEVDLSQVEVAGAVVEREPVAGPPRGYLHPRPYASGETMISGYGKSVGSGFSSASIELSPSGSGEWTPLCGPLGPSMLGEYECEWDTTTGAYPDGSYELRAQLSDSETPPNTAPTSTISVLVDNTRPTGSLNSSPYIGGTHLLTGTATDSSSGIASWQLQIARTESSEWTDACPAQTTPISGEEYGCTPDTGSYSPGTYQMRALIADNAGNTYTTDAEDTTLDTTPPAGSLDPLSETPYLSATLNISGAATDAGSGVATWTPQIAVAGTNEWADLCPAQSNPLSGSTYGCETDTTEHPDGAYLFRALVTDEVGNNYTTSTQEFTIDNTPPSGALDYLPRLSNGLIDMHGSANDLTSGVASWTLQIAPADQSSWTQACLTQLLPTEGIDSYGCSVDTTSYPDGAYQVRAAITDGAGHTYITQAIPLRIHNDEGAVSSCTDTWTGGAEDSSWQSSANWSAGTIPASSDIACIPAGHTVTLTSGSVAVGWLEGEGSVVISDGSLAVTDTAVPSSIGSLTVREATLTGGGEVDVTSVLNIDEATLAGGGKTVLEAGGSGAIESYDATTLAAHTLINHGTLAWKSGAIIAEDDASLENTGTFYANDDGAHCGGGCIGAGIQPGTGGASFTNSSSGKIIKEAGDQTYIAIPFSNQGDVEAASGELQLSDGGVLGEISAGSWTATSSGSMIEFDGGSFKLADHVTISGQIAITGGTVSASTLQAQHASVEIEAGTLTVEGTTPSQIESLSIGRGPNGTSNDSLLDGDSDIQVSDSFIWDGGIISGTGSLALEPSSTGTIEPYGQSILISKKLINYGTLGWESGSLIGAQGAELLNEGTFATNDLYAAECLGCQGMQTADWLRSIFGETYFTGDTWATETPITGEARFANEGTAVDPKTTCPPRESEVEWPASGEGEFNDTCTNYINLEYPTRPQIEGQPEEGQELTVTTGSWESIPYPTFSYQWQRCTLEESGYNCADIPGETTATYVPTSEDVESSLRVNVTAHERLRTRTVTSEETLPISAIWTETPGEPEEIEDSTDPEGGGAESTEEFIPDEGGTPQIRRLSSPALTPDGGAVSRFGYHRYTPRDLHYRDNYPDIVSGLPDGEFGNQAAFNKGDPRLQWGFKMDINRVAEAVGEVEESQAVYKLPSGKPFQFGGGSHPKPEPAWYLWHGVVKAFLKQEYQLAVNLRYTCYSDGRAGDCRIYARHDYKLEN